MAELTLLNQALEMINLAKSKGFDQFSEISPVMYEPWMPGEKAFCNTACAIIAMWLRDKHIQVTVLYRLFREELYYYEVHCFTIKYKSDLYYKSYEEAWIKGITDGINALPPGAEM